MFQLHILTNPQTKQKEQFHSLALASARARALETTLDSYHGTSLRDLRRKVRGTFHPSRKNRRAQSRLAVNMASYLSVGGESSKGRTKPGALKH